MLYLRITCSELPASRRREIAQHLTDEINDLFYTPRAPVSREELRERTTVHFTPYSENEMFIGARTPQGLWSSCPIGACRNGSSARLRGISPRFRFA
jgi:hypothetical protein